MIQNCAFCNIISGKTTTQILYHDDQVTAFRDTHPITPFHIFVVPNQHITSLNDIQTEHEALLGHLIYIGHQIAEQAGLQHSGYRLVINTGPDAGQSIFHLHLHVIGGRPMPFKM